MSEEKEILSLMVRDHARIEKLLQEFQQSLSGSVENVSKSFQSLKWEFEKHLFAEEKTVFTFYNPKSKEEYSVVLDMLKDHQSLLVMLKKMEMNLEAGKRVDLNGFRALLNQHKCFEENFFYPKLDRCLSKEQKKHLLERLETFSV
jgi:hemerythrin-like domain-containing protein